MATTAKWYGQAALGQYSADTNRRVDWVGDTIKVALFTATYTPDQDLDVFLSNISGESTGTGYTAGGIALTGKSTSYDATSNETRLIAGTTTFSNVSVTARYLVVYKNGASAAASPLLGYVDFGGPQTVTAANLVINWDPSGVLTVVAL